LVVTLTACVPQEPAAKFTVFEVRVLLFAVMAMEKMPPPRGEIVTPRWS